MKATIVLIAFLHTLFSFAISLPAQQASEKNATQLTIYSAPSMKNIASTAQAANAVNALINLARKLETEPKFESPTSMAIVSPRVCCALPGGYALKLHRIIYPNDKITECAEYEHRASGAFVKMYTSYNKKQPTVLSTHYAYAKSNPQSTNENLLAQLSATLRMVK